MMIPPHFIGLTAVRELTGARLPALSRRLFLGVRISILVVILKILLMPFRTALLAVQNKDGGKFYL